MATVGRSDPALKALNQIATSVDRLQRQIAVVEQQQTAIQIKLNECLKVLAKSSAVDPGDLTERLDRLAKDNKRIGRRLGVGIRI